MNKKLIFRICFGVIVVLLFILVIVSIIRSNNKNPNIENDPVYMNPDRSMTPEVRKPEQEEIVVETEFENKTSMSDEELNKVITNNAETLASHFDSVSFYNLKDVGTGYSDEENNSYIVVTADYVKGLSNLFANEAKEGILENFKVINISKSVNIDGPLYMVRRDFFENVSKRSAVAWENVNTRLLTLMAADDTRIETTITIGNCADITNCDLDPEVDDTYQFILVFEDDMWKVLQF